MARQMRKGSLLSVEDTTAPHTATRELLTTFTRGASIQFIYPRLQRHQPSRILLMLFQLTFAPTTLITNGYSETSHFKQRSTAIGFRDAAVPPEPLRAVLKADTVHLLD